MEMGVINLEFYHNLQHITLRLTVEDPDQRDELLWLGFLKQKGIIYEAREKWWEMCIATLGCVLYTDFWFMTGQHTPIRNKRFNKALVRETNGQYALDS